MRTAILFFTAAVVVDTVILLTGERKALRNVGNLCCSIGFLELARSLKNSNPSR